MTKKYALISVFDKTGIVDLAKVISKSGYEIISTGGTAKVLTGAQIPIVPIQEITGNPEAFDGRMKTISFQIESGILYDRSLKKHVKQAKELKIPQIDLVICNLYPFAETIKKSGVTDLAAIEQIDVGGPTMIRAAAKNYHHVLVVTQPSDYVELVAVLKQKKGTVAFRKTLAARAFAHISAYDSTIANYLSEEEFPTQLTVAAEKKLTLRYGENPHQVAAFYTTHSSSPLANLEKLWGRGLSATNIEDISAGIECVRLFAEAAAAVIKHTSPCGVAVGNTAKNALERAIASDPESAFGGTIVLNRPMDTNTAALIGSFKDEGHGNIDIVAVPGIQEKALAYLEKIRKSMGIYTFGSIPKQLPQKHFRFVDGGVIAQSYDRADDNFKNWQFVTKRKPTPQQIKQMRTGWKFISRIKSNTIIIMDKLLPMTRGIGSGQTSRIRATKIALEQAGNWAQGAVLVSDSFFPFPDGVEVAAKAGVTAIIQQGGSINDPKVIAAADKANIAMVFTGRRAFWH